MIHWFNENGPLRIIAMKVSNIRVGSSTISFVIRALAIFKEWMSKGRFYQEFSLVDDQLSFPSQHSKIIFLNLSKINIDSKLQKFAMVYPLIYQILQLNKPSLWATTQLWRWAVRETANYGETTSSRAIREQISNSLSNLSVMKWVSGKTFFV